MSQNSKLKKCSNGECDKLEKRTNEFSVCSLCKNVQYCSRKCQKNHWRIHKKECRKQSKIATQESEKKEVVQGKDEEEEKTINKDVKEKVAGANESSDPEPKIEPNEVTLDEGSENALEKEDVKLDKNEGVEEEEEEEEEDVGEDIEIDHEDIENDASTELFPSEPRLDEEFSKKIETEYSFIEAVEEDENEEEGEDYDNYEEEGEDLDEDEEAEKELLEEIERTKDIGKLLQQKDRTLERLGTKCNELRESIKEEEKNNRRLKRNLTEVSANFRELEKSFSHESGLNTTGEVPKLLTSSYSSSIFQSFQLMDRYMRHQVRRRGIDDDIHKIEEERMKKVKNLVNKQSKFRNEYQKKVVDSETELRELKWKVEDVKRSFYTKIGLVVLLFVLILFWLED